MSSLNECFIGDYNDGVNMINSSNQLVHSGGHAMTLNTESAIIGYWDK